MTREKFSSLERILEPQIVKEEANGVEVKTPVSQTVNLRGLKLNYAENFFKLKGEVSSILYRKKEFLTCAKITNSAVEANAEILSIENGIDSFGSPVLVFNFSFSTQEDVRRFEEKFRKLFKVM